MLVSPYRLTALTVAGGLLASAGFLGSGLHAVYRSSPLLIFGILFLLGGLACMYWAGHTLREGVQNENWSAETVAPFRRVIDHPLWKGVMGVLLVALLIAFIKDRHERTYFWGVFCLLQTQTQITNAFARPRKPSGTGARLDWSEVSPLHSDHWGER